VTDANGKILLDEQKRANEESDKQDQEKQDAEIERMIATSDMQAAILDAEGKALLEENQATNRAIEEGAKKVEEASAKMRERISGDLADMIIGAQSASEVFKTLAKDILRVIVQKQITDQIANTVMGSSIFKSAAKVLGFAGGGEPPVGQASIVGENGPELFVPKTAGTIVPAGRTAQAMKSGGGVAVNQTFNFQSGVTKGEIAALIPAIVQASKAAVLDAAQRGGGYRRAFA
jgi:hypothetical protein